jgi:hypothetical protein
MERLGMNIKKIAITRKFNLGNYESLDLTAEADLLETDGLTASLMILRESIEMAYTDMQRVKPAAPQKPAPQTVKSPMQLANEATTQREAAKGDPTKCPKCGGRKSKRSHNASYATPKKKNKQLSN